MAKIIIFGTSDLSELAHFYFNHDSDHEVVAFSVNSAFIKEKQFKDLPIIPFEDIENVYSPNQFQFFIPLTGRNMNKNREKIYFEAKGKGYKLVSYISSKATVWPEAEIGENCFIFEDNTIQPFTKIGNNVILWSGNHIGHHSEIKDHVFFTSHVVLSGHCVVDSYCYFGVNSTIRDGISIASECVIGAGTVILKNTKQKQVYTTKSTILISKASDELKNL